VEEAEIGFVIVCQILPVGAHRFKQLVGPEDVGLDEDFETMNAADDVGFGNENGNDVVAVCYRDDAAHVRPPS